FSVADEGPDLRLVTRQKASGPKITIEPSLVNRQQRPQTHGNGRELPEVGHQIRVRIRGKPAALRQLLAEIVQLPLVKSPLQKSPGVNARSRVPLEIDQVPGETIPGRPKKMIEGDFV